MTLPSDRSGGTITLHIAGQDPIDDEKILALVPDFHLDAVTTDLFGGNRLWRYEFPFPETDAKIIAIEYGEFAQAISEGRAVEVGADQGTRSVAVSYAILESGSSDIRSQLTNCLRNRSMSTSRRLTRASEYRPLM